MNKRITLLFPLVIILVVLTQLCFKEKKFAQKRAKLPAAMNPSPSSRDITTTLAFSLNKINAQQKAEKEGKKNLAVERDNIEEEKKANDDLNYLIDRNLFYNDFNNESFNRNSGHTQGAIEGRVASNQKLYNSILTFKLEDALLAQDNLASTELFALAKTLPLGPSALQATAEKILIDLIIMERKWDEGLFKSALEFYYAQNLIKGERENRLVQNFADQCPDENLKTKILKIDQETSLHMQSNEEKKG